VTAEPTVNDAVFWRNLYAQGSDRWELGRPNPSLAAHLDRHPLSAGVVAVPGCGRGHDARLLARQGHRVLAFDFVTETLRVARALAAQDGVEVCFEERDIFELGVVYPGFFDGVWEYTCFCAIDPRRRPQYIDVLARILKPGGWLLACFFPMGDTPGGPPFAVNEAEVRALLASRFEILEDYAPSTSPEGRQGREWMVLARRRGVAAE